MPHLPGKVTRRHRRPIRAQASPSAPPSATSATPAMQNEGGCLQVTRLPRKTKVNVAERHTCHVKRKWMSPGATPATQRNAASPATNPGPSAPKRATKCNKRHTCHAKRRWMSLSPTPSATPATQSTAASPATNPGPSAHKRTQARHQVQQAPCLPRKTEVDVTKCHACHAKRRCMSPSATPATQKCKMVCDKVVCESWWVTK